MEIMGKVLFLSVVVIFVGENFAVLVVFDFYLRMEIMGKVLFLSEGHRVSCKA
jgi:hypothetical protein